MKKILHLIPRFSFGGAEKLVLEYARRYHKKDFEMSVASVRGGGDLEKYFEEAGVKIFVTSKQNYGGIWWQWRALRDFVKNYQPDIIHSHVFSGDLFAYLLRQFVVPRAKWISTQHNVEFAAPRLRHFVWNFILPQADKVIAVSPAVLNYSYEYFGVLKNKMELVPNGVCLEEWLDVPTANFEKNKEWRLATIGRLEYQKGHRYLFEALAQVTDLPWQLDVYGEGSLDTYLKELAKKLRIPQRISWHGALGGMPQEIKNNNVVIQPSLWEGMSLVVMEAMAAGRLLIASEVAGKDLVDHGENGFLVPEKDVAGLARAIRYHFEHPEEAGRLAENAREYARTHFNIKDNIAAVEEIYSELLGLSS